MRRLTCMILLMIVLVPLAAARAQEASNQLTLSLRKDFGFAMGSRIQGKFTLSAHGPDSLESVEFWIDDQLLAKDEQAPFETSFSTSSYPVGPHVLRATGWTISGEELAAEPISAQFLSGEAAWAETRAILIPLVAGVVVFMVLASVLPVVLARRRPHNPGEYGAGGGAVCPHCGLPFALQWFGLNLLTAKLQRCPHCHKWAAVRRATNLKLKQAEEKLMSGSSSVGQSTRAEGEDLSRLIDESRYDDGA